MDSRAIIELERVGFRRDGNEILKGINWSVSRGDHWAMVGPNGSGKTTLLRIVAGYSWPTEGTVRVLGERFGEASLPELRKRIGWVNSAFKEMLPGWHSARGVVLSGLEASIGVYKDFDDAQVARANDMLDAFGCLHLAQRDYGTLSQGEQQRVLIARALLNDPELIVLDEPCVGLDPAATESFLDDLSRVAERENAPSIVFVTHRIDEIRPFVKYVAVLKDGEIIGQGGVEETLTGKVLSRAFDCVCEVVRNNGRYALEMRNQSVG